MFGVYFQIDNMPGIMTWIGAILIGVAINILNLGE